MSITCHEGRMDGLARQCVYIHLPMYPGEYNRPVTAFQPDSRKLEPLSYPKKKTRTSQLYMMPWTASTWCFVPGDRNPASNAYEFPHLAREPRY